MSPTKLPVSFAASAQDPELSDVMVELRLDSEHGDAAHMVVSHPLSGSTIEPDCETRPTRPVVARHVPISPVVSGIRVGRHALELAGNGGDIRWNTGNGHDEWF